MHMHHSGSSHKSFQTVQTTPGGIDTDRESSVYVGSESGSLATGLE